MAMETRTESVSDWTELAAAVERAGSGGSVTIELTSDIPAAGHDAIVIAGGRNITLTSGAGGPFVLYQQTNGQRHFLINEGVLTLQNVILSGNQANVTWNHGGVAVGTVTNRLRQLNMGAGSVITNNRFGQGGGVFLQNSGVLVMSGGTVSGNVSTGAGGGVSATGGSTFTMNSGTIEGNMAVTQAGGVQVAGSTFTIGNGNIQNNTASTGGGVHVINVASTMTMQGGMIQNNEATGTDGGGVSVTGSSTFLMTGGTISDNAAAAQGGGVNVLSPNAINSTTFQMQGGVIQNNGAGTNGGGVMVWGGAVFTMTNGILYDNEADNGGGVHVQGGATRFALEGGAIYENTARGTGVNSGGGGVNILSGTFTMTGGIIRNNFAASNGGGVRRGPATDAFFAMTGGNIRDNRTDGAGGALFAQGEVYSPIVPATAYPRIAIGPAAVFSGNWAATGAFRPDNIDAIRDRIETTSATLFGHPINNFDINYRTGQQVTARTITYVATAYGSFDPPGAPDVRTETIHVDTATLPVFPQLVPTVTAIAGHTFLGWVREGVPTFELLNETQVRALPITDDTTFIAQYEEVISPTPTPIPTPTPTPTVTPTPTPNPTSTPSPPSTPGAPQTGDVREAGLYIALLIAGVLCTGSAIGYGVWRKFVRRR